MKKIIAMLLAVTLLLSVLVPVSAAEPYDGKVVLIVTGNERGNVDELIYTSGLRNHFEEMGAEVVLADAGNFLQGNIYTALDRGECMYDLMAAARYDVVAMGRHDFAFGDATTGYVYHGNFHKYYTQRELTLGCEELNYKAGNKSDALTTRPAREAAPFAVIGAAEYDCEGTSFYFEQSCTIDLDGLKLTFVAPTEPDINEHLQDNDQLGYRSADPIVKGENELVISFGDKLELPDYVDLAVYCQAHELEDGGMTEVYVIDKATGEIEKIEVPGSYVDDEIRTMVDAIHEKTDNDLFVTFNHVEFNGTDRANWSRETNLGDLTADALLWYGEYGFEGFKHDVPLVAIQNGGNCDNNLPEGVVTQVDLLRALPFSPMGVGILYVTGAQLLETLEAGTSPSASYAEGMCPGFAQVAGLEYTVDAWKPYDAGEAYGKFYRADSVNRVTINSVNGQPFDENATYAVIADNYVLNGNDTYYTFKEAKAAEDAVYLNNGNGVLTRDVVAQYIKASGINWSNGYAEPAGRITVNTEEVYVNPYTDVAEGLWYYDSVRFVTQNGLMNGVSNDRFSPNSNMNRAMLVTVLYRMENSPEASEFENPFEDVRPGLWYTDAVCWAAANGVVNGNTLTTFAPMRSITRQDMVVMICRYAEKVRGLDVSISGDLSAFDDADTVSGYAVSSMTWAVENALVHGIAPTELAPLHTTTRAQVATVLMNFAK